MLVRNHKDEKPPGFTLAIASSGVHLKVTQCMKTGSKWVCLAAPSNWFSTTWQQPDRVRCVEAVKHIQKTTWPQVSRCEDTKMTSWTFKAIYCCVVTYLSCVQASFTLWRDMANVWRGYIQILLLRSKHKTGSVLTGHQVLKPGSKTMYKVFFF